MILPWSTGRDSEVFYVQPKLLEVPKHGKNPGVLRIWPIFFYQCKETNGLKHFNLSILLDSCNFFICPSPVCSGDTEKRTVSCNKNTTLIHVSIASNGTPRNHVGPTNHLHGKYVASTQRQAQQMQPLEQND